MCAPPVPTAKPLQAEFPPGGISVSDHRQSPGPGPVRQVGDSYPRPNRVLPDQSKAVHHDGMDEPTEEELQDLLPGDDRFDWDDDEHEFSPHC